MICKMAEVRDEARFSNTSRSMQRVHFQFFLIPVYHSTKFTKDEDVGRQCKKKWENQSKQIDLGLKPVAIFDDPKVPRFIVETTEIWDFVVLNQHA